MEALGLFNLAAFTAPFRGLRHFCTNFPSVASTFCAALFGSQKACLVQCKSTLNLHSLQWKCSKAAIKMPAMHFKASDLCVMPRRVTHVIASGVVFGLCQ